MQIGCGQRLIFEPHHLEEEEEDAVRPTPGGGGWAGERAGAREIVGRGEASEREVRAREDIQKDSEFVDEFGHSEFVHSKSEREASRKLRFWRWRRRLAAWRLKRGLVVKTSWIEEQTGEGGQEEGYVLASARAAVADGEGGGTGKERGR
jgi:hypothetical protein